MVDIRLEVKPCKERLFAGTRQLAHNVDRVTKVYYFYLSVLETCTLFHGQENKIGNVTEKTICMSERFFLRLSKAILCYHNLLSHHKEQNKVLLVCVFKE